VADVIERAATFARSRGKLEVAVARATVDCAFLVAVTVISVLPYIRGLGFYYDDYSVLERMHTTTHQSLAGAYDAVRPATGQRPLQALIFAVLYRLFGLHPLGYHVVNACLLAAVAVLLYLVLRELRLPRLACVTVPVVYATLPHYATNRFWLNAFQINLSSLLYLLSLYAALRAVRARPWPLAAWVTLAVACIVGSLFAYEVVFPLFAVNIVLLWWAGRRRGEPVSAGRWITIGGVAGAMLVAGAVKATLVAEHGQNAYRIGIRSGLAHHVAYLVSGSIKVNVGTYLLAVPYVVWWVVRHRLSASGACAAVAAGLAAMLFVRRVAASDRDFLDDARQWLRLAAAGAVVFILGYAIFATNQQVLFRSAGIDNRVNAAAALGVALAAVGAVGWIATRLPERRRPASFAAAVGVVVATGVLIVEGLGGFWTAAAKEQHAIVDSLRDTHPALPSSSTVVLDGVCPETGPAVVFADQWDFRNALRMSYGDTSLRADTATDALRAAGRSLTVAGTFLGTPFARSYRYGPRLFVYDFPGRKLHPIPDRAAAARYVAGRAAPGCAPQRGFAWGFDPSSRTSLP
jgi:hypothetical protein